MSLATPHVRPYQPGDALAFPELLGELGHPVTLPEVEERMARLLASPAQAVFVVETLGKIVGWAHVQERAALHTPPAAELSAIVVAHPERGAGFGRMLVQAAEQWARAHGCVQLVLRSNVERHDAHRFYASLGYVNASTSCKFVKRLG